MIEVFAKIILLRCILRLARVGVQGAISRHFTSIRSESERVCAQVYHPRNCIP